MPKTALKKSRPQKTKPARRTRTQPAADLENPIAELSHLPVLAQQVLDTLEPAQGMVIVDGTLGGAGHTRLLLERGASVIGIDQDPFAHQRLQAQYGELANLQVIHGNFRHMDTLLRGAGITQVDGVLLDIGVSSFQVDDAQRGFSYHHEAPLDMRMSQSGPSAADAVNELPEEELAALIYEYGEERHSRRIARAIVYRREERAITTTTELADIIKRAYPGQHARGIHPARRTFQALRIYVNDELGALRDGLSAAASILKPEGRLAVISFHSLEDRIVKHFLRTRTDLEALSKRPLEASETELLQNPRARSAKLRGAVKRSGQLEGEARA